MENSKIREKLEKVSKLTDKKEGVVAVNKTSLKDNENYVQVGKLETTKGQFLKSLRAI